MLGVVAIDLEVGLRLDEKSAETHTRMKIGGGDHHHHALLVRARLLLHDDHHLPYIRTEPV